MSIESKIYEVLRALVSDRVFPDYAPFNTERPFITYQQFGGKPLTFLEKALPSKKNGLFQIHVWADTRAQAAQIANAVEVALVQAPTFEADPMTGARAAHDPDIPIYGSAQDFSIWFDR